MYIGLHVGYLLFLSDSIKTLLLVDWFLKNGNISNFMKVHPVGAKLFTQIDGRRDEQIDMMKLIVTFHSFTNAPKNVSIKSRVHKLILYVGKQGNFGNYGKLQVIWSNKEVFLYNIKYNIENIHTFHYETEMYLSTELIMLLYYMPVPPSS